MGFEGTTGIPDRKIERDPNETRILVGFNCEKVDNLLQLVEREARNEPSLVMLKEFDLAVDDAIRHFADLRESAKKHHINIILAPANPAVRIGPEPSMAGWERAGGDDRTEQVTYARENWATLKKKIRASDPSVEIEQEAIPESDEPESMGMYFGKDGRVFVFPKSWAARPVHVVPGTSTGISICGEIRDAKPEHLVGIETLYNPSRENDDPWLSLRMQGLAGEVPTRDEIRNQLLQNPNYNYLLDDSRYPTDRSYDPARGIVRAKSR
ncbi:hypothetical protein HY969_04950 [Candidatus Kaiserbacteria bacterium]|nr:hypothetical protein [Candidatus Kaiserbacteria bacterium]